MGTFTFQNCIQKLSLTYPFSTVCRPVSSVITPKGLGRLSHLICVRTVLVLTLTRSEKHLPSLVHFPRLQISNLRFTCKVFAQCQVGHQGESGKRTYRLCIHKNSPRRVVAYVCECLDPSLAGGLMGPLEFSKPQRSQPQLNFDFTAPALETGTSRPILQQEIPFPGKSRMQKHWCMAQPVLREESSVFVVG